MKDARKNWLQHMRPAMARLRDACKDDGSGITARDIQEVADAIAEMTDALVDFESFVDDIE